MASAMMAVEDFNTRNSSIVPELGNANPIMKKCRITFDPTVIDTGTSSHKAVMTLSDKMLKHGYSPDAIAGPYNELPSQELSSLATGTSTPIVSHRASNYNLVRPEKNPMFTQLSADVSIFCVLF